MIHRGEIARYLPWTDGLSDAEVARRLVGAAVQVARPYFTEGAGHARTLRSSWGPWGYRSRRVSDAEAATALQQLRSEIPIEHLALEFEPHPLEYRLSVDVADLVNGVDLDVDLGFSTVASIVCLPPLHRPSRWQWPLSVAYQPDDTVLKAAVRRLQWSDFARVRELGRRRERSELALLRGDGRSALRSALESGPWNIQILVCFSTPPRDGEDWLGTALLEAAGADVLCFVSVSAGEEGDWLDHMLLHLSHDLTFDVAVRQAARGAPADVFRIYSRADALAYASVSYWAQGVIRRLARGRGVETLESTGAEASGLKRVAADVAQRIAKAGFLRETGDASDLARDGDRARAAAVEPETRLVKATLRSDGLVIQRAPIRPAVYELELHIGPPDREAIHAPDREAIHAPVPFPEDHLPPRSVGQGYDIDVVLVAPGVLDQPETRRLFLPENGASEPVSFRLDVSEECTRVDARVALLHGNRVLQTLRLRAEVGAGLERPLQLELEGVVRADFGDLDERERYRGALLLNTLNEEKSITFYADGRAQLLKTSGAVDEAFAAISDVLERIAAGMDRERKKTRDYKSPASKATREALYELAHSGTVLLQRLRGVRTADEMLRSGTGPLQIIAAQPERVLPLEYCYEGPAPTEPAVCKQWKAALKTGKCAEAKGCEPKQVVCPVRFWGLSRAIERHTLHPLDAQHVVSSDFAVQSEPRAGRRVLPVLRGGLCAASSRARNVDAAAVDAAFQKVASATGTAVAAVEVHDWEAWLDQVGRERPALQVLLAHTDSIGLVRHLEIGSAHKLPIGSIERAHTGAADPGPLVLLLGCSTAASPIPLQSFVLQLKDAGAAIVVGTLSSILGRSAARATEAIIERLEAAATSEEGVALGELMVQLRRQLLAEGIPSALALVAFGDADWRIGGHS